MMRQLALTVTTALLAVGLVVSPVLAEQIQWAQNLDQARLLASQQNKLLLIHFWTPDCGPCKTIESKVFPTAMVAAAINRHFVPLKVNAYENEALRSHFDVRKWPTDVVSTVDGQQLSQMVTSQDPAKYVNKLMMIAGQNLNAKPAGMSQQTPNSLVSHPGAIHHATAQQQPQATQAQPTGTQLPNLRANSAMARRPGVDPAMRPGTGLHMQTPNFEATPSNLGAQMPGREPAATGMVSNPNVIANQPGLTNSPKRSRYDNDFAASPAPATPASQPMATKPSEITNHSRPRSRTANANGCRHTSRQRCVKSVRDAKHARITILDSRRRTTAGRHDSTIVVDGWHPIECNSKSLCKRGKSKPAASGPESIRWPGSQ